MDDECNILLSFDIEEFDLPHEYKQYIPLEEQLAAGFNGLQEIGKVLSHHSVHATLFTTAVFAENFPWAIRQLSRKHEIGSHSNSHSRFAEPDLEYSRKKLEAITGREITGLRMPRMLTVDPGWIKSAGYQYNSSINPTWLPGRYNNLHISRHPFWEKDLLQFPVSVSPHWRIPLFWLAFRNMPYNLYLRLVLQTLRTDKYVCLYFHPWEFIDLSAYHLPFYIKKNNHKKMLAKFERLVDDLSGEGRFITMGRYIEEKLSNRFAGKRILSEMLP